MSESAAERLLTGRPERLSSVSGFANRTVWRFLSATVVHRLVALRE